MRLGSETAKGSGYTEHMRVSNTGANTVRLNTARAFSHSAAMETVFGGSCDNCYQTVQCANNFALINFRVRASDRLDDQMACNCVNMGDILTTTHTWRLSQHGNVNADDTYYECGCAANEVITGIRAYATSRLDYALAIRCTRLAAGYATTATAESIDRGYQANDNRFHFAKCPAGFWPTRLHLRASNFLDDDVHFYCAGITQ
jgi:hypothetical protein